MITYKTDSPQSCAVNLLDLMRDDVADLQRLPLFRDSHISINALSLTVKVPLDKALETLSRRCYIGNDPGTSHSPAQGQHLATKIGSEDVYLDKQVFNAS